MDILYQSSQDIGAQGWDERTGWGCVNARRAVELATGFTTGADSTPPTVSFTSPAASTTVTGTAAITVTASDNVGVSGVTLTANGVPVGTDTSAPYTFSWSTAGVLGSCTLIATARDAAENTGTASMVVNVQNSSIDTTAPTVTITSPAEAHLITQSTTPVTVNAVDNVGVVRAELYVNGGLIANSNNSPFTLKWNTRRLARGTYTVTVKAFDARGNSGVSAPVVVQK
jgi:hypothetical protein